MLTLRRYKPSDFDRLVEIDQACFVEGIAYSEEEMWHFLSLASALVFVAEENGKVQGFIIADRIRTRRKSRYLGRVITIDVAPGAQHHGIGSRLLIKAEEELKAHHCDAVILEVAVDNEKAFLFYKKHGYSVLRILPRYYLDSLDGLQMGKEL